jgi:hypothetical protein
VSRPESMRGPLSIPQAARTAGDWSADLLQWSGPQGSTSCFSTSKARRERGYPFAEALALTEGCNLPHFTEWA